MSSDTESEDVNMVGTVMNNRYVLIHILGSGSFSTVWLSYNIKDKKFYAVKVHNADDYEVGLDEVELIKGFKKSSRYINKHHENFIYRSEDGEHVCLVFDLLAGSIYDLIKHGEYSEGLPVNTVKSVIKQLLTAMSELNKKYKKIHTDIKPENILIEGVNQSIADKIDEFKSFNIDKRLKNRGNLHKIAKNIVDRMAHSTDEPESMIIDKKYLDNIRIRLADFGNCVDLDYNSFDIQTRYYRAPEMILGYPYNERCDVWSIGCLVYELITGKLLFDPDKSPRFYRDRQHLHEITALIGRIPQHLLDRSEKKKYFYRNNGMPKGVEGVEGVDKFKNRNLHEEIDQPDKEIIVDFIISCLHYDPNSRPEPKMLLSHKFLK